MALPFLYDLDAHARFLIALPLLVLAERVVHERMRPLVGQFVERGLIAGASIPRFDAALASAVRLRNSVLVEVGLIVLVYAVGVGFVWRTHSAVDVTSWYGGTAGGRWQPSLAGWWLACVSLPLFQFILIRWYFRLFVWARFLWQVSRIPMAIVPTHPDRCGGLGFLGGVSSAFAPWLLAQGALVAGTYRQPDLLRRGQAAAVQDRDHRGGGAAAVRRDGPADGLRPGPGPGEAGRAA